MAGQAGKEWLVIIPDMEGSSEKRPLLGKQHTSEMEPDRGSLWLVGGMLLDKHPDQGTAKKVVGNAIIAQASSKEVLLAQLQKDCYASGGVWDMQKIQIYPFESFFRVGTDK